MKNQNEDQNIQRYQIDVELLGDVILHRPDSPDCSLYLDTVTGEPIAALPEEEQDKCFTAKRLLNDDTNRFAPLYRIPAITEFTWMENFAHFVDDDAIREKLQKILSVSSMIEGFNVEIRKHPPYWDLWLAHLNSNKVLEAENILAEHGIEEGEKFVFLREGKS